MLDELSKEIIQAVKEKNPQNLEQLMDILKARHPLTTEQRIFETILALQKAGEMKLENQFLQPQKSFSERIKTPKALWYWITLAFAFITAFTMIAVPEYLQVFGLLRVFLGASFVFWFPGYSFVKAIFLGESSRSSSTSFETVERIALSIGMSLSIVSIVGLFLHYSPWGISLVPIVLCLVTLTLIFSTFAIVREFVLKEDTVTCA